MGNAEELAELYYNDFVGYYPEEKDFQNTKKVLEYLVEASVKDNAILSMFELLHNKKVITSDDLPDLLWEHSLLKKNTFYYHKTLHIMPSAPVLDLHSRKIIQQPFYLEMKIQYTYDDLISYFYRVTSCPSELRDNKRDKGSFEFLLKKYEKLPNFEAIDFVLALIDSYRNEIVTPLQITNHEIEVLQSMNYKALNSKAEGADQIKWR